MTMKHLYFLCAATAGISFGMWQHNWWAGLFAYAVSDFLADIAYAQRGYE
jgi:hypothetical protein